VEQEGAHKNLETYDEKTCWENVIMCSAWLVEMENFELCLEYSMSIQPATPTAMQYYFLNKLNTFYICICFDFSPLLDLCLTFFV
jgi:hypothetical protein